MENSDQFNQKKAPEVHTEDHLNDPEVGVQHDEQGNIIKIAENAVPPKAWENQQKAYNDAFERNKNQQLDDDI